jgi:hypothetical protein
MNEFCLETKHATATKATTLKKDCIHIYDLNFFPTLHKITSTTTTTTYYLPTIPQSQLVPSQTFPLTKKLTTYIRYTVTPN